MTSPTEPERARQDLLDAGLAFPPLPNDLPAQLQRFGAWHWGTRELDPLSMYMFEGLAGTEENSGPPPDYMALCHAGHGINSYALNYQLVYRPLAVMFQVGWGGICMDETEQAARFYRLCELSESVVALACRARHAEIATAEFALIRYSEFREVCALDVLEASNLVSGSRRPSSRPRLLGHEPESVYEAAKAWLAARL